MEDRRKVVLPTLNWMLYAESKPTNTYPTREPEEEQDFEQCNESKQFIEVEEVVTFLVRNIL